MLPKIWHSCVLVFVNRSLYFFFVNIDESHNLCTCCADRNSKWQQRGQLSRISARKGQKLRKVCSNMCKSLFDWTMSLIELKLLSPWSCVNYWVLLHTSLVVIFLVKLWKVSLNRLCIHFPILLMNKNELCSTLFLSFILLIIKSLFFLRCYCWKLCQCTH